MVSLLQTRDRLGLIKTIAKFEAPIHQKEIESKYGAGCYCMKETSPRFRVIWKGWIGERSQRDEVERRQSRDIQSLKKNVGYLAIGEAILAVGEIAGGALTVSNFVNHGLRLNRIEVIATIINSRKPLGLICPECLHPLRDALGAYCGDCGSALDWTQRRPTREPTGTLCPNCSYPVDFAQKFCTQCGKSTSEGKWVFRGLP